MRDARGPGARRRPLRVAEIFGGGASGRTMCDGGSLCAEGTALRSRDAFRRAGEKLLPDSRQPIASTRVNRLRRFWRRRVSSVPMQQADCEADEFEEKFM